MLRPTHVLAAGAVAGLLALNQVAVASDDERSGNSGRPKNTFNIMMNYELGMHCTGFEFAYCCVLPPYNSILAQVVKTQQRSQGEGAFARLLEGDPKVGLDGLGRQTVLRDPDLGGRGSPYQGTSQKYVVEYWHDAQPRNDGRGKPQGDDRLISAVEGNSLFMWATIYDQADTDDGNKLRTSDNYNGAEGVVVGDGIIEPIKDSYANGWMNHLYVYADLEGSNPNNSTLEKDKIRLGLENLNASTPLPLVFPPDCGPAAHPMGPVTKVDPFNPDDQRTVPNECGGFANGNVLTFSGEHGTIVYTQMKVLENLPVTLTSPRIWEALGLPLTPFEDSIDFFGDPGLVDEESIRPYVEMRARLRYYDPNQPGGMGAIVMQNGNPVTGLGTAPIDIPNCERCHSNAPDAPNSPQAGKDTQWALVQAEYNFWNTFYGIVPGEPELDSDWYSRLKSAAISMLYDHDQQHGTSFTAAYATVDDEGNIIGEIGADPSDPNNPGFGTFPQNTRLGHESVICQKCHADNVIAVVKSATCAAGNEKCEEGTLIRPISEAMHRNHRNATEVDEAGIEGVIVFNDSLGRDGGCQGCHPAHRSDGDMAGYPITEDGANFYADDDNRLASGGCFVGRDVHSNPMKDVDGAETPSHLNAVGEWLVENVAQDQGDWRGIWCTNCHTQLSQEIWRNENMVNLIEGTPGKEADLVTDAVNIRALPTLEDIAEAVGVSLDQAEAWLDPKVFGRQVNGEDVDATHDIWRADIPDANVAIVEVKGNDGCSDGFEPYLDPTFNVDVCAQIDDDGDPSYRILEGFCTTPDCVTLAQNTLDAEGKGGTAVAVPFSAATDGRDHWLSPGEPHCADCHAAPYVEQSGNINAFAPFNYPRKASLMRYSRGHRDISCQGCHESIHGLYPVTPNIDTTTYAQAASMNSDDSHGPLKCGACHEVNSNGVHERMDDLRYDGQRVRSNFDAAVGWAHTFTEEKSPLDNMCVNCHGDESDEVSAREEEWQEHAMRGRASRPMMDQVEIELLGSIAGTVVNPDGTVEVTEASARNSVCRACHGDEWREVSCNGEDGREWKRHLSEGRVSPVVWEGVSDLRTNTTCGW